MKNYLYRPILRWKRGEKIAVQSLSHPGRAQVIPIFVIGPDQYRIRPQTRSRTAQLAEQFLINELMTYWPSGPFYIDAADIVGTPGTHHPIVDIATAAYSAGLQLIPATRLTAPLHYQQGVVQVHNSFSCGAAIRADLQGMASAQSWSPQWPIPIQYTDLIVDFANNVNNAASLGSSLAISFNQMHAAGFWRSTTVAGTSMPDNFGGYTAGLYTIPRTELNLWRLLSNSIRYRLDFGDYATVPINPASGNIAWGFPINVKYTLQDDFLICRGLPTTGYTGVDMDRQLISHAANIVNYPTRFPLAHCWADDKIDRIAAGSEGPGNLETWVQIGVNRHIEITRHQLP